MPEDREQLIRITTATQVASAKTYSAIMRENPLLAKFMLKKFKEFLEDSEITTLERQTILIKFFMQHTDYDLIQDVITFINTCKLNRDYFEIVTEWTYHNSEKIKKSNLKKYDAELLAETVDPCETGKLKFDSTTDKYVQSIIDITVDNIGDSNIITTEELIDPESDEYMVDDNTIPPEDWEQTDE